MDKATMRTKASAEVVKKKRSGLVLGGTFVVTCYDKNGKLKWQTTSKNKVVDEGIYHILDVIFNVIDQDRKFFVGLTDGSPTVAAGDTLASHSGWNEVTGYEDADRPEFVDQRSNEIVKNSDNLAIFGFNGSYTLGGAFLCNQQDKASTDGILLTVTAFSEGDLSVSAGDDVHVQYTFEGHSVT